MGVGVGRRREEAQPPEGLEEGRSLQKQLAAVWALSQSFAGRPGAGVPAPKEPRDFDL